MPGLFSALSSTATALNAQSQAINITSNNIANLNNPDYSREVAVFSDLGSVPSPNGPQSTGITVNVEQMRNAVLDQMVRQEASVTSGFQSEQDLLNQAQASLGQNITSSASSATSTSTTTTSGLSAAIDNFFNAFQGLAADPTNSGQAQSLIQQAGVLTDRFQEVDQNLSQVQANATAGVTGNLSTANGLLQQIATLNNQINSLEVDKPGSAVELRDERAAALEKLAGFVPITAKEDSQGEVQVTANDTLGGTVSLVTGAAVANTLGASATQVTAGSPAVVLAVASGSIQGTLSASNGPVQALRDGLTALAQQIVTSVNGAYNSGNSSTGNFFAPAGRAAGTIAVDPNLTVGTLKAGVGASGDNSLALAVSALANHTFSAAGGDAITGTISQFYAGAVSTLGQALDTANTQVTDQQNVQTIVNNQRQSESGVSVNEEMGNLLTYQRAFQASSEVFQVISSLLETIVTNLGH